MYLSFNWLNEYVNITDIDPHEIAHRLTMCTSEIESVEEVGGKLDPGKVVIGKILEVKPHPDSDHLFLTKTDVGRETLDIVSGAPNTAAGTFVPVALIGATLPGGMKVKKAKLRGAVSYGVVCSEKELDISDDHSGLWILNEDGVNEHSLEAGTPLEQLFGTHDFIFEIDNKSITNRPDLWGHYGFAREIAALYGRELVPLMDEKRRSDVLTSTAGRKIGVQILDAELCPRYTAIGLSGIAIGKAPYYMRRRLSTLGVRPISNIVDVTNYVMLLTGQPLHAFDARHISDRTIIVRRAAKNEKVTTLDGVKRSCSEETLLITDAEKAVAVAGVMGGLNSEIDDGTDEIIIEAANFNPASIRRTAMRLGLRTEASNRFEKSLDPELALDGLCASALLVRDLLPGVSFSSPLADAYPGKRKKVTINLNCNWVSNLLGVSIDKERITGILNSLQFKVDNAKRDDLVVTVPSFRATKDVSIPQDLVEEVGRIVGYDNITPMLPRIESAPPYRVESLLFSRELKNLLAGDLSFTELFTYSFIDDAQAGLFYDSTSFVTLKNPVSAEMSRLRRSIVPNLFATLSRNSTLRDEFSIFEIGSVYAPPSKKKSDGLPDERTYVSGMVLSKIGASDRGSVFFETKGKVESLLTKLNMHDLRFSPLTELNHFKKTYNVDDLGTGEAAHPGRSALLCSGDTCFGILAELNPKFLKRIGMDFHLYRAGFFEIDLYLLMELVKQSRENTQYVPAPRFPEVALAFAVVVDETVPVLEVREYISSFKSTSKLLDRIELFDVYRGKSLEQGKKSLAFNVYYRRDDRTLTEKEANEVHEQIAEEIRKHGWSLR
jgi:phenylalanyl-tRNA synthetase beta chain